MESYIALSDLQNQIRAVIEQGVEREQWVVAEISELKVNYSGHCYLELVERQEGAKTPAAQVRGVIWSSTFKMISGYFRFETGGDLAAGMKVLVKCTVTYHPVYGLSLNISDIDPAYTIGETERLRRQTIAKLQEEGVFDMNRDFELPLVVQRIAVISSAKAAGYQDFVRQLEDSGYGFELELYASVMQGDAAEESIVRALDRIAASERDYEAVILIRGGGSTSDLGAFDGYRLCAYIAQFPLPVITGIGHDKDVSVADMVAHTSLKTPTAVAAFLIDRARDMHGLLEAFQGRITERATQYLIQEAHRLDRLSVLMEAKTGRVFNAGMVFVQGLQERVKMKVASHLERETARLEKLAVLVDAGSPKRILSRGYALIRDSDGKAVLSAKRVKAGDGLRVEMRDGTIDAEVKTIWTD